MNKFLVKHAYGRVYDVFANSGWNEWTRVFYKKGEVIFIKGIPLDKEEKKSISKIIQTLDNENA